MIVMIYAKYKKNPSKTVDATEQTQFSRSRPNDLEDIGQGQRSSHATHPLMLLIICTKYGKNPSWTVDATGRTWKVNGQTDRRTDKVNPIMDIHDARYLWISIMQLWIFIIQLRISIIALWEHITAHWNYCTQLASSYPDPEVQMASSPVIFTR